jgi:hypothetical protein
MSDKTNNVSVEAIRDLIKKWREAGGSLNPHDMADQLEEFLPAPPPLSLLDLSTEERDHLLFKEVWIGSEEEGSKTRLVGVSETRGAVLVYLPDTYFPAVHLLPFKEILVLPKQGLPHPNDVPAGEAWVIDVNPDTPRGSWAKGRRVRAIRYYDDLYAHWITWDGDSRLVSLEDHEIKLITRLTPED